MILFIYKFPFCSLHCLFLLLGILFLVQIFCLFICLESVQNCSFKCFCHCYFNICKHLCYLGVFHMMIVFSHFW
jgi:hypothetical protein